MSFCTNCGNSLSPNAKYCNRCGNAILEFDYANKRHEEFSGKIIKCPNCGEVIKAFELNCPACGFEFRGTKASASVKEFVYKLEVIESRREYEKPRKLYSKVSSDWISKTDEQKISLIKSFAIPNSKEDLLEFMILATSNINLGVYAAAISPTKGDIELNDAWLSKAQQVYEKAKRIYSSDDVFEEIRALYDSCNKEIKKAQKKKKHDEFRIIAFPLGLQILLIVALVSWITISGENSKKKEIDRLEAIEEEIKEQLEAGEYKYALMNTHYLVYKSDYDKEDQERRWEVKREYWIDRVVEEAARNGVTLERPKEVEVDDSDNQELGGEKNIATDDTTKEKEEH